jgi:hypothetical protein
MKEVVLLLNELCAVGVLSQYALFGALAQIRYTAAVATLDADVLVALPSQARLDVLQPIYDFCQKKGYRPEGEAIRVGAWPVQFFPVFSPLTQDAMEHAEVSDFEGLPFRVVRADYLAVIALSVGRTKDFSRILALLESRVVSRVEIADLATKYNLYGAWKSFEKSYLHG